MENEPYHCGAGGSVIEIHFPTSSFPAYPDPNPVSIAFAGDIKKIGGKATLEIVFHANPEPKEFRSSLILRYKMSTNFTATELFFAAGSFLTWQSP